MQFMTVREKHISKGYWNPKGKLGSCIFGDNYPAIFLKIFEMQNNIWIFSKLKLNYL